MFQNIKNPALEIMAQHYPDETPGELLKRVQQHLAFVRNLPPKLLAYTQGLSLQTTLQPKAPGMLYQYNASLSQNIMKLKQDPVLTINNQIREQFDKMDKINHLDLDLAAKSRDISSLKSSLKSGLKFY